MIQGLEGEVVRVVVTELRGGTFYATLAIRNKLAVELDVRGGFNRNAEAPLHILQAMPAAEHANPRPLSKSENGVAACTCPTERRQIRRAPTRVAIGGIESLGVGRKIRGASLWTPCRIAARRDHACHRRHRSVR